VKDRPRTFARVRLTVEFPVASSWGPECKLDQVFRQAAEEAEGIVRNKLAAHRVRIVGPIEVEAITTTGSQS
jgi:hypothetical protein